VVARRRRRGRGRGHRCAGVTDSRVVTVLAAATSVGFGFLIGAFGTLVGAGGGFLLVPLLVLGYGFAPADAVGTSLSLVFLNALSGSAAYLRQRRVDLSLGWKFAAATLPGAVGGAYLTRALRARLRPRVRAPLAGDRGAPVRRDPAAALGARGTPEHRRYRRRSASLPGRCVEGRRRQLRRRGLVQRVRDRRRHHPRTVPH